MSTRWTVFTDGAPIGAEFATRAEADVAAADVRGDFPDVLVEVDVVSAEPPADIG